MRLSTAIITATYTGGVAGQLYLSNVFDKYRAAAIQQPHATFPEINDAQRPLGKVTATSAKGSADLPSYKAGQFTLTPQDDTVCATNGESQWTGTIDVTDDRRLFFWAFESRNDPKNDPVIFWMNGGPGGSSLIGLFTECGACTLPNGTLKTEPNEWAWNNNATVVFLDQPASVGFSSVREGGKMPTGDWDSAVDFQTFLNIFFDKVFPDKAHLPIHIAAESYGGHYGPVYLHHILESRRHDSRSAFWGDIASLILVDAVIDFSGAATGHWDMMCNNYRSQGILTEEECEEIMLATPKAEELGRICEQTNENTACMMVMDYSEKHISHSYDLKVESGERNPYHLHRPCLDFPLCSNIEKGNMTEYLNQKHVKEALKFPESFVFDQINWDLNSAYVNTSAGKSTAPQASAILDAYMTPKLVDDGKPIGDVKILVLNGNEDPGIHTAGNKMQWDRVVWSRMAEYRAAQWRDLADEDVAATGEWKATHDGRLAFVAVDKAGHMVPGDTPEGAYRILQRWMAGGWKP